MFEVTGYFFKIETCLARVSLLPLEALLCFYFALNFNRWRQTMHFYFYTLAINNFVVNLIKMD